MRYELKGNYFEGNYHLPSINHLKDTLSKIKKYSPANLNDLLWEVPIEYGHKNFSYYRVVNKAPKIKTTFYINDTIALPMWLNSLF